MGTLLNEIQAEAEKAVASFQDRAGGKLDYSEASLVVVEEMLAEAAEYRCDLPEQQINSLVQFFGCYILEVARRMYGGEYFWLEQQNSPVLAVGEPNTHIAIASWNKVRGRLNGDSSDNIPFFYAGFAEQARLKIPGKRVLFV